MAALREYQSCHFPADRRMEVTPNEQYTVYEADVPGEAAAINEDEDILNYDDVDDPEAFA